MDQTAVSDDPFETDPEPQGPQHFERGGKQYVRDSRMQDIFRFLDNFNYKESTRDFLDSLEIQWDSWGSLSKSQYRCLIKELDERGGFEAMEDETLIIDTEDPRDQEGGMYFGE